MVQKFTRFNLVLNDILIVNYKIFLCIYYIMHISKKEAHLHRILAMNVISKSDDIIISQLHISMIFL